MRTYKYPIRKHSKNKRLGNLLDDRHEVHKYFHLWQRQRYADGLPYANYHAMSAHLTELKKTTHLCQLGRVCEVRQSSVS